MRSIGRIEGEDLASRLGDVLLVEGIPNQVEQASDGSWEVWVHAEDQVEAALALKKHYMRHAHDPEYDGVDEKAKELRRAEEEQERDAGKRLKSSADLFGGSFSRLGYVTMSLVAVSVMLFALKALTPGDHYPSALYITDIQFDGDSMRFFPGFVDVRAGQVWRLFTPALLHFGFIHLLFNMMWLLDLGGMIERVQGPLKLAFMVVLIAVCSNAAQFAVSENPNFGGMSGVVYGLLGYIWMKGKFDPWCGMALHQSTVTMMLVWYVICLLGFMPIANTVHTVGLVMGVAWGFLSAKMQKS